MQYYYIRIAYYVRFAWRRNESDKTSGESAISESISKQASDLLR